MFRSPLLFGVLPLLSLALAACGGADPVATSSCSADVAPGRLRVEVSGHLATAPFVAAGRCGSFACVKPSLTAGTLGCAAWEGNIYGNGECEVRVLPADGSASHRAFASTATCKGTGAEIVFGGASEGPPPVTATTPALTEDDGSFHTAEDHF